MTIPPDHHAPLHPVPETTQAMDELEPTTTDPLGQLLELGERASRLVPSLVGLSVGYSAGGVVFTLVASDERVARLDGMQYVDGGPCVAALFEARVVATDPEALLDEGRWTLFALASAAAGVRATLTIPVLDGTEVVGTVNLYAADPGAFHGELHTLADLFGGWAEGVTRDADLEFRTRELAREAPARLDAEMTIETAVGLLAGLTGLEVDKARRTMEDAALRAGVSLLDLAQTIVETRGGAGDR